MSNPNYVLNHKNIKRIDFSYKLGKINVSKSVLFNHTRISEAEVIELINNDMYKYDNRVVVISLNQLKNLTDKEVL